jgi:hypothetical protein
MALNDIVFVKGQGGLGRPAQGEDFISGLLLYSDDLPSGFDSTHRVKPVLSVAQAEALGIVNDYSDAIKAQGVIYFDTIGDNGDKVTITVEDINGSINLGTYTKTSAQTTQAQQHTALANVINAGTYQHGYTAEEDGACIIYAPKRNGIFLNTGTKLFATYSPTSCQLSVDSTVVQFADGTYSKLALYHYHISEFFRLNPTGKLFIGIYAPTMGYNFEELTLLQTAANGKCRQIAIYHLDYSFDPTSLTTIQGVCNTNAANHKPFSVLYGADLIEFSLSADLPNLQNLTASNVSAVISQDFGGLGGYLYKHCGRSVTNIGALAGSVSAAKVSTDIAWVANFNISDGVECDTVGFANGQLLSEISQQLLNQLDDYRYIFLIKYVGVNGTYWNDSHTAITIASDYAYIENVRTIDKAIRGVYSTLIQDLNSPLKLNADGTLTDAIVAYFESQGGLPLAQMARDNELSAYSVVIDPAQDVLATSNLNVTVKLLPIGVARQITVNIGFTTKI